MLRNTNASLKNFVEMEKKAQNSTEDPRYLAFRTELLLLDWFASHATKADRHFARFLQHPSNKPVQNKTGTIHTAM